MINDKSGINFENATAELFRLMGFAVQRDLLIAGSQVDLLIQKQTGPFCERYIVECKDHLEPISITSLRTFYATLLAARQDLPGTNALFVSKRGLTKEAKAFAQSVGIQHATLEELERRLIDLHPYANYLIDSFQSSPLSKHYIELDAYQRRPRKTKSISALRSQLRRFLSWSDVSRELPRGEREKLVGALASSHSLEEISAAISRHPQIEKRKSVINDIVQSFHAGENQVSDFQPASSSRRETLLRLVEKWLAEKVPSGLVILGDYGTGKTSCMKYLAARYAKKFLDSAGASRCPFLINLKDYPNGILVHGLASDVSQQLGCAHLDWPLLHRYLAKGRLLILLDGFDEMGFQVDARLRRMHFASILKLIEIPNSKVIVTGRPAYFPSYDEYEEIIELMDIPLESRAEKVIGTIEVASFNNNQVGKYIASFADSLGSDKLAEVKHVIDHVYNLRDLAERPFLLDLILRTIPECDANLTEVTPASLYDLYTTKWVDREYAKGEFRWLISKQEKRAFMTELAWTMFRKASLVIHFSELSAWVGDYFHLSSPETVDYFAHDIRTCSFLRRDDTGKYSFIHRSFMEYFVAVKIVDTIKEGTGLEVFFKEIAFREESANSIAFALDLLNESLPHEKEFLLHILPANALFEPMKRLRNLPAGVRRRLFAFLAENSAYNQIFDLSEVSGSPLLVKPKKKPARRRPKKKSDTQKEPVFCSFCDSANSQVEKMITAGPTTNICDRCVTSLLLRETLLLDQLTKGRSRHQRCSFCGKPDREVKHIFLSARSSVGICNQCADICYEILSDDYLEKKSKT